MLKWDDFSIACFSSRLASVHCCPAVNVWTQMCMTLLTFPIQNGLFSLAYIYWKGLIKNHQAWSVNVAFLFVCVSANSPLILCQANIADFGDNQWVMCFQDSAEAILGQNAAYLGQLKDSVSFTLALILFFYAFSSCDTWKRGLEGWPA